MICDFTIAGTIKNMANILIFGGTFDPVHKGHLAVAQCVQNEFSFAEFLFLPCKTPELKNMPATTTQMRLEMLSLALQPFPQFKIELEEVARNTPSYMIETVHNMYKKYPPPCTLTLLMGFDVFKSLPLWQEWEEIITTTNILVVRRTQQNNLPAELQTCMRLREVHDKNEFLRAKSGRIMQFNAGNYDISSTAVRNMLQNQEDVQHLIPPVIYNYIAQKNLYVK